MTEPIINIMTLSGINRVGLKGPNAEQWLQAQNIAVPSTPNSWLETSDQVMVLRLGKTEFLIESLTGYACFARIFAAAQPIATGVYRVMRADVTYNLTGNQIAPLLAELCSLDLSQNALPTNTLLMTQLAGISVIVIRKEVDAQSEYRLWCDASYGDYLQESLQEV
ncbi:MAG: hypothetical protein U1E13_01070, partial [Methylophilaceae bacterium]|nr:hypothetical protein [Methylophilaceae bacterium]